MAVWNHALSAADVENVFSIGPQWLRFATNPQPANEATAGSTNLTLTWTAGETATGHHVYISQSEKDVRNSTGDSDRGITTETSFPGYPFELGKTYFWRVDEIEADGVTVYPGAVWSFTVSAKLASQPVPADGAILVDPNATLSWTAGSGAASHSVYLGTDPNAPSLVSQGQTDTTYDPAQLEFGTTYFWRVDEIADDGTVTKGNVWNFTVADYLIVDDFESYTDNMDANEAIFQTWTDGYGSSDNGSQVGYTDSPVAERAFVHSGRQSMPLQYANLGGIVVSEARRSWTSRQDWSIHGLGRIVLYVRGGADNVAMPLYVTIADAAGRSATTVNADANIVLATDWVEWSIAFSVLSPVDMAQVETMVIGLGDRANPTNGEGIVYVDDFQVRVPR